MRQCVMKQGLSAETELCDDPSSLPIPEGNCMIATAVDPNPTEELLVTLLKCKVR